MVGIQFRGSSLIRQHNNNYNHNHKNDDARFSSNVGSRSGSVGSGSTSILQQREPDVVLKPCTEGLQFTLQLLSANRMAKVVEWQWQTLPGNCNTNNDIDNDNNNNDDNENENDNGGDNGGESGIVELDEEDIRTLFGVICGQLKDDDNDENDNDESDNDDEKKHDEKKHDDLEVTETYQGPSSEYNFAHGGLPYLESLSILGNDTGSSNHQNHHNPSFMLTLTLFLSSTHHVVGFTNLTLRCLNLRGSALELRALTEALRLHPKIRRVQMLSCWFSPEQQQHMEALQQVLLQQQQQQQQAFHSSIGITAATTATTKNVNMEDGPVLLFQRQGATLPPSTSVAGGAAAPTMMLPTFASTTAVPRSSISTTNNNRISVAELNHNNINSNSSSSSKNDNNNNETSCHAASNTTTPSSSPLGSWWEKFLNACFCFGVK